MKRLTVEEKQRRARVRAFRTMDEALMEEEDRPTVKLKPGEVRHIKGNITVK